MQFQVIERKTDFRANLADMAAKSINTYMTKIVISLLFFLSTSLPAPAVAIGWFKSDKCAALLSGKRSILQRLSRYRTPDIEKARSIIGSWTEMSLAQYREFYRKNPDAQVFVGIKSADKPMGVLGDVEMLELNSGYAVFAIKDSRGRMHAVDLDQSDLVVHVPTNGSPLSNIDFVGRFSESSFFKVNLSMLSNVVETQPNDPVILRETERIRGMIENTVNQRKLSVVKEIYDKIAELAGYATMPAIILWGGTSIARALGIGTESFLIQHASNFYFGVVGMALMHGGLSQIWPNKRFQILTATVLTNVGFNVIEEIDLGLRFGRISNGASTQFGTDWLDFNAGMLSIGVYLATVAVAESISYLRNFRENPAPPKLGN